MEVFHATCHYRADDSRDCVASEAQRFRVNWPETKVQFLGDAEKGLCLDTSGSELSLWGHYRSSQDAPGKPDKKPNLKNGRPALLLPCPRATNNEFTEITNGWWDRSDYVHLKIKGTSAFLLSRTQLWGVRES